MQMCKPSARRRVDERGSILGMSAIAMLALLGAVGLGIDISHTYSIAAELQNAADAAALAGASALNSGTTGIDGAVTRATREMNRFEFNHTTIGSDFVVSFGTTLSTFNNGDGLGIDAAKGDASNVKFVKIRVPAKTVATVAARAVLQAFSNAEVAEFAVSRSAVAGQSVDLSGVCHFVPITMVQDGINDLPVLIGSPCSQKKTFEPECAYKIKLGSANGNSISAGDFLVLSPAGDRGGADVKRRLGFGVDICANINASLGLDTAPGTKAGPVSKGLNTRFDDFKGVGQELTPELVPPDKNIKAGDTFSYTQYKNATPGSADFEAAKSSPSQADRRVLILPIVNANSFDKSKSEVKVASFGAFFMRTPVSEGKGEFIAEFVKDKVVIGNGYYTPGGQPIPGLTVPVLYR
ncbi:MAG: hypothetical protein HOP19_12555 [Acidobacteria bacterium]|nr:hypothetical protein [Acidobacteriota bacterium]